MNGLEIRALREKIGLKRPQLVERAGPPLTVAKLAGIETGRDPRYDELQALTAAFQQFDAGRKFLAGEKDAVAEIIKPKAAKSDPSRWTAENPTIDAQLRALTSNLAGGRNRKRVEVIPNPKFVKFDEWGGFKPGDPVQIKAKTFDVPNASNWEKGTFTFLQRVLNKDTGDSWMDVFGGTDGRNGKLGRKQVRSFTEDRVVKAAKSRE